MLLSKETENIQSEFAAYCRNKNEINLPGIIPERAKQYRRLIFNIFEDNLITSFPISYKYLPSLVWKKLVQHFFEHHKAQTNQIWKLPFEFYEFVVEQNLAFKYNIPYLEELLYFEWIEIELYMMEDLPIPEYRSSGDWKNTQLVFNPEFKIIQFKYPVFKTKPNELNKEPDNYFLLIYREKETGKVQFIELPATYTFILEACAIANNSVSKAIIMIKNFVKIDHEAAFENEISTFLKDLKQRNFLLGFA